jgi:hypothetical protein
MNTSQPRPVTRSEIESPASTGWPLIAALGITLLAAGLLTHLLVGLLGGLLLIAGLVGWFRAVIPHEAHEVVVVSESGFISRDGAVVGSHLEVGEKNHRARLPLAVHPYSAGLIGGRAGGAAMAVLAIIYGTIRYHSMWYPVNLLAAVGSARIAALTHEQLLLFSWVGLWLACIIHLSISSLVGLLYAVILPIFPSRPVLVGGVVAPLLWSGLLYGGEGVINPVLNARIDWFWFITSQFVFGLVAGLVVTRREKIRTMQHQPFTMRAGFEASSAPETDEPKVQA